MFPSFKKKKIYIYIYIFIYLFIYLFLAVLGLRCCVGFSLVAVGRLLLAVASLAAEQGLPDSRAQAQ